MSRSLGVVVVALLVTSIACTRGRHAPWAADEIARRTGHGPSLERRPEDPPALPPQIVVADGLDGDEAAAIALWNNPALRADFARVGLAEADLMAARRPANPSFRFFPAAGPMQFYLWLAWPLDSLIALPKRVRVARANLDVVTGQVVQTGLDLARDVRLLHVAWALSHARLTVRRELAAGLDAVAKIAEARAAEGDVPLSDADAARGDALVARDEVGRAEEDAVIAGAQLFVAMGFRVAPDVRPAREEVPDASQFGGPDLEALAVAARPDLRAAQRAVEAAGERVGLEKLAVLRLTGIVYSKGGAGGPTGVQGGPEVTLPIFDQNQGGIGRARADLEAALWRYQDLHNRIVADVLEAQARLRQASRSLATYRETLVATRERELDAATASFEMGEQSYLPVLMATGRLESVKLREIELSADVRRAVALLERAVGRRLGPMPQAHGASEGGT